jgi:GT2 family glycosyltransferase/SAM-dependent methyltransferase
MGEIFRRPQPRKGLSWTGERFTTIARGEVEIEHLHRYFVAREMCRGLDVLDVASGEGYGSALLAQSAKSVVGVELSQETVDHAKREYTADNLRYVQGDARRIPAPDHCVDAVVSFETLEHFYEHEAFFKEVRRVLRPNGFLLVSTPDLNVYSISNTEPNPYHVHELTHQEFDAVLRSHFPSVAICGQRMLAGSVLAQPDSVMQELLTFERRGDDHYEMGRGVVRAKYLLGVATLGEQLPAIPASVFVEATAVEQMLAAVGQVVALQQDGKEVRAELERAGGYARSLEAALNDKDQALDDRDQALQNVQQQAQALLNELQRAEGYAHTLAAGLKEKQKALEEVRALSATVQQSQNATNAELTRLSAELAEARNQLAHAAAGLNDTSARLDDTSVRLHGVLASTSWRVTAPLRDLSASFPRVRAFASRQLAAHPRLRTVARRGIKAIWWTATGQLGKKLAARRARKGSAAAQPAEAAPAPAPAPAQTTAPAELLCVLPVAQAAVALAEEATPLTPKQLAMQEAQRELECFLDAGERLALRSERLPLISVLVVTWNAAYFTLKCLRALAAEMKLADTPPFEVIVFDNASTDRTAELLARADGVRVINSASNIGFLRGCNEAAPQARGQALLLLNSDAFVRAGTLRAAWERLRSAPDVGAVGARLVHTTGLLQEAGALVWADASTQGYCRGMAAETDEVMFARDVDYCSGAFLMTKLSDWHGLGGFDERYAPAYYEEVDYCLRLRERGLRVVYEPGACVDHFEFGSESKRGDAIEQSIRNQKKLRERHARFLRTSCLPPSAPNVLFARTASKPRMGRLLVVDNEVPFESLGSGYPRCRAMINAASQAGWAVTFFSLHNPNTDWARVRAEFNPDVEFIVDRTVMRLPEFLQERHGYYDAAIVSRPDNMRLVSKVLEVSPHLLRGTRIVYDAEALFATRAALEATWAGRATQPSATQEAINEEVSLALDADAVICVNELEAAQFRNRLKVPVSVLSHAVKDVGAMVPFERRRGFLFVGRLLEPSAPNWVGLAWFIKEVWPQIRARIKDATLDIVGHVRQDRAELMAPGVRILGAVEDLSSVFASARVFVAPIHFAAGIPIKILDASAAGLPVVATPLMAEQLDWSVPLEIRTAALADSFAENAVELHEQAAMWGAQSAAARARVARDHSAQAFASSLSLILGSDAPPAAVSAPPAVLALPAAIKKLSSVRPKVAHA